MNKKERERGNHASRSTDLPIVERRERQGGKPMEDMYGWA